MRPRNRVARIAWRALRIVLAILLGSALLLTLAVYTLRFQVVQAQVLPRVNTSLAGLFRGRIEITRLASASFEGVRGIDAKLLDPEGRALIELRDSDVDVFWPKLLWQALIARPESLSIELRRVVIGHVHVRLVEDSTGTLTLVRAFEPKTPKQETQEAGDTQVVFRVLAASIRHAWVDGKLGELPLDGELRGATGTFESTPEHLALDVMSGLWVRALPGKLDPRGQLALELGIPSQKPLSQARAKAKFRGTLARAESQVDFQLENQRVQARLESPRVGQQSFATFLPQVTPRNPVALRAEAHGSLPVVNLSLEAQNADARVAADARLTLRNDSEVSAKLRVTALDLSGFIAASPKTSLGFEAETELAVAPEGRLTGDYRVNSLGLVIEGVNYPAVRASGKFSSGPAQGTDLRGSVQIDEPGTSLFVRHDASRLDTRAGKVSLAARAKLADPPRFSKYFSGLGELEAEAVVMPGLGTLEARVTGRLERIRSASLKVRNLELEGDVRGKLDNPRISARLRGSGTTFLERELERFVVTLDGSQDEALLAARVEAKKPKLVELTTRVTFEPELVFTTPRATVQDGPSFSLGIQAERVVLGKQEKRLEGFLLTGSGNARASLRVTDRLRHLELSTSALALSEILEHLDLEQPVRPGRVDLEARYADDPRTGPIGTLSGTVDAIRVDGSENAQLRADFALSNRTTTGTLEASVAGGTLLLTAEELRLPERLDANLSLDELDGELGVKAHLELKPIERLLTRFLPIGAVSGTLDLDGQLGRSREPRLVMRVSGKQLRVVGLRKNEPSPRGAAPEKKAIPWRVDDLTLEGAMELDLRTRAARADASLSDRHGALLTAHASATPEPGVPTRLREVPLEVRVLVPPRSFERFPALLSPRSLRGAAALDLELEGSVEAPQVRARASVNCFRSFTTRRSIDVELDLEADHGGGQLSLRALRDRKTLGKLETRWEGDLAKIEDPLGQSPVRGDLSLNLERFPIEMLPPAARRDVRGPFSGKVELRGVGRAAELSVDLRSDALEIGPRPAQHFTLALSSRNHQLTGTLALGEPASHARAELTTSLLWDDHLLPSLEPKLEGRFTAKNFELGTLLPWVASDVSELGGAVNADFKATLSDGRPLLEGSVGLERGVIQIPAVGQRFSGVQGKISINRGNVQLESFSARGTSGKVEATGNAKLDGLTLESAEMHVDVDRDDEIPITLQGAAVGYAWGKLGAKLETTQNDNQTRVLVDVPELHVKLPSSNPASLQDLEAEPTVRAGTRLPEGEFVVLPIEPPRGAATRAPVGPDTTLVEVKLGNQVWIERGEQVDVQVGGKVQVRPGSKTPVQGTIELRDGTLDVRGKRFRIERGSVSFTGPDPSNPTIMALASWESPDGYRVTAEYSGTARQGKLSLHSEPNLTENEILSMLLFGSPDGSAGAAQGTSAGKAAIGFASESVVQSFNHVLSSLTNLDVSARLDTSTGTSRPEISVQLSPRLTARVTFAVGTPTAGQAPDRTFLTVDLRLKRSWALSAMLGDRGASALDLIWRKRY